MAAIGSATNARMADMLEAHGTLDETLVEDALS